MCNRGQQTGVPGVGCMVVGDRQDPALERSNSLKQGERALVVEHEIGSPPATGENPLEVAYDRIAIGKKGDDIGIQDGGVPEKRADITYKSDAKSRLGRPIGYGTVEQRSGVHGGVKASPNHGYELSRGVWAQGNSHVAVDVAGFIADRKVTNSSL